MSTTIRFTKSPEENELEKKLVELASLESELVQRELELTTLQADLQVFEIRYLRTIGSKFAALDDINARIAEAVAKIHQKDDPAISEAKEARDQANESARAAGTAHAQPETLDEFQPTESLISLYREAAKRFHPDLAADENDRKRRTPIMVAVNAAYKAADEDGLRRLLREWQDSPENVAGDDFGAKLIRVIRKIAQARMRLSGVESEINTFKQTDLYVLRGRVQAAECENRDLLREMAVQLDKRIAEQQLHLDALLDTFTKSQTEDRPYG